MKIANQKLILAGVVAAIMLSGCGKKAPTGAATPVTFGDDEEIANPIAPSTVPGEAYADNTLPPAGITQLTDSETPAGDPYADVTPDTNVNTNVDTAAADAKKAEEAAAAKKLEDDAAAKKAADEAAAAKLAESDAAAKKLADEAAAAKKKADAEAAAQKKKDEAAAKLAEELAAKTPTFKKIIGNGSLHSANGIAIASGILYVVDNARQGLLGKFAAVRSYETATGDFKSSFENIGWAGAKNLPTSVNRVKIADGKILAGDDAKTYTFSSDGSLLETADASFALVTEVDVPGSEDAWKIKSGKVVRVDGDGDVLLTLSADEIAAPVSVAVDADGNLYVSDATKHAVVVFTAPAD